MAASRAVAICAARRFPTVTAVGAATHFCELVEPAGNSPRPNWICESYCWVTCLMAVVAMSHFDGPLATIGSFIEPDLSNAMYMFEFTFAAWNSSPPQVGAPPSGLEGRQVPSLPQLEPMLQPVVRQSFTQRPIESHSW